MKLEDRFGFEDLINEAERLVLTELGRQLEVADAGVPQDEEHVLDMAAYALNHVRPMYRVNLLGRLYANTFSEEHGEDIRAAAAEAIRVVTRNRR